MAITKSELIELLSKRFDHISVKEVEQSVKLLLEEMSEQLAAGTRIEIRGFGSLNLNFRSGRICRNPKTGEQVSVVGKCVPHFKPGKELRDRVNEAMLLEVAQSACGLPYAAGSGLGGDTPAE